MKSKMRKIEVAKGNQPHNYLANKEDDEQVHVWLDKIREIEVKYDGSRAQTQAIASLLIRLSQEIQAGRVGKQVIFKVVEIAKCKAAMQEAFNTLKGGRK